MDRRLTPLDDPFFSGHQSYFPRYFGDMGTSSLLPYQHHHHHRRNREDPFAEMNRDFDSIVRDVDDRFAGILSRVDSDPFGRTRIPIDVEGKDTTTAVAVTPEKFDLSVSVQDFKPEEVSVKVKGDQVMVHAKRENKKEDEGMYAYSFREFKRTFTIPEGVDAEHLTSSLTPGGLLKIEAPVKKEQKSIEQAKNIPVEHEK